MIRRLVFGVGAVTLALVVAAITGEIAVRVTEPTPRRVMFREAVLHGFYAIDGVWMWPDVLGYDPPRPVVLEDRGCDRPTAFTVMVVGDSILNGVDLDPSLVGTVLLKQRLIERLQAAGLPDANACVVNLAVPGFSLVQGLARARERIPSVRPDVLVIELWGGAPRVPARIGDTIYFFEGMTRDALGNANPLDLPPAWNAALIDYSRLFEYVVLSWPEDCRDCRYDLAPFRELLDDTVDLVEAHGGEVVGVMPARLSYPFDAQPEPLINENAQWEAWLAEHDLRHVRLWEAFEGLDPAALAMDPVHLNAAGQVELAKALEALVWPAADRWAARQRDGSGGPRRVTTPRSDTTVDR